MEKIFHTFCSKSIEDNKTVFVFIFFILKLSEKVLFFKRKFVGRCRFFRSGNFMFFNNISKRNAIFPKEMP